MMYKPVFVKRHSAINIVMVPTLRSLLIPKYLEISFHTREEELE